MSAFVLGTKTFFNQTTAPTGWTKDTGYDDYTIRIVSGSTGNTNYGVNGFTTVLNSSMTWPGSVSGVTGTLDAANADLPAHTHTFRYASYPFSSTRYGTANPTGFKIAGAGTTTTSGSAGTGSSHTHNISGTGTITGDNMNMAVTYVDFILASKS